MSSKPKGFSLIEVSMVLAISVVMMGVVAGVYRQRRNIANDDAAQQIASIVQTVQNEAKQGQGPASGTVGFAAGDTLWGNAVQFAASCPGNTDKSCFVIYKLKQTAAGISSYDSYQIATPENFKINKFDPYDKVVVFRNSTGQAFMFIGNDPFGTGTDPWGFGIYDAGTPTKYVTPGTAYISFSSTSSGPGTTMSYILKVSPYDISIKR